MGDRLHDPALEGAETLPAAWYRDAEHFEQERARVLGRSWHLAGRVRRERVPGAALRIEVAEPLLVVTGEDEQLRALSAVCRHRAGPVSPSPGRRGLRCAYHGWSYDFDGRLVAAPEMDGAIDFDRAACSLPRARVEAWGGFASVTLDPEAPPLAEVLGLRAGLRSGRRGAAGGRCDLRPGAAGTVLAGLRARPLLAAPRERRAPLPRAAHQNAGGRVGQGPIRRA